MVGLNDQAEGRRLVGQNAHVGVQLASEGEADIHRPAGHIVHGLLGLPGLHGEGNARIGDRKVVHHLRQEMQGGGVEG